LQILLNERFPRSVVAVSIRDVKVCNLMAVSCRGRFQNVDEFVASRLPEHFSQDTDGAGGQVFHQHAPSLEIYGRAKT
jgi:hypothetical protein